MKNKKTGILLPILFAFIAIVFSILIWGNYGYKYNEIYVHSDINTYYVGKYKTSGYEEDENISSFKLSGLYKNDDIITKFSGFNSEYYNDNEAVLFYNNSIYVVSVVDNNYKVRECIKKEIINDLDYYIIDFDNVNGYVNSLADITKIIDNTYNGSMYEIDNESIKLKACYIKDGKKVWSDSYIYSVSFENNDIIVETI